MALGPDPTLTSIPTTPTYVPVFPFYEAEPTWFYKGYGTSGGDGGSGGDDDLVLLFSETVTTAVDPEYPEESAGAKLTYSGYIDAESIIVTYDEIEYVCTRISSVNNVYGAQWSESLNAYDFSVYPFCLVSYNTSAFLATQTEGRHTISVKVHQSEVPVPSGPDPK